MDLQKINVKFFVADSSGVPLKAFINIFNSWIQASDGDYYDLADYSHMHAGPGIFLIAHEAHIGMDNTGNRLGLLYNRKQPLRGSNQEKLRLIYRSALENCHRIEEEPSFQGRFKFRGNKALFLINDRLLAPNTKETFQAVKPDLEDLVSKLYAGADFSLYHNNSDPRERFSVHIRTSAPLEMSTLLKNLGDN